MSKILFLFTVSVLFCSNFSSAEQKVHLVVSGDTLWELAGKYYNNPWAWKKIYDANKETIKDPHWIFPEQQFVIPEIAEIETSVVTTDRISSRRTKDKKARNTHSNTLT